MLVSAGSSVEWLARIVLRQPQVQLSIVLGTVLFGGLAWWLATRYRWRRWAALAAGGGLALALSVTVVRTHSLGYQGFSALAHCALNGPRLRSGEELLNLVLFVPFGFFLALAWRRMLPAWVAVLACAMGVEAAQAVFALGSCDTRDVVGNVLGGCCAAAVARAADRVSNGGAGTREADRAVDEVPHVR